jgi:hypothetical protein
VGVSVVLSQYAWEGPPNTNPWFVMDFGKPGLDAAAGWADEHIEAEVGPPGGGGGAGEGPDDACSCWQHSAAKAPLIFVDQTLTCLDCILSS